MMSNDVEPSLLQAGGPQVKCVRERGQSATDRPGTPREFSGEISQFRRILPRRAHESNSVMAGVVAGVLFFFDFKRAQSQRLAV